MSPVVSGPARVRFGGEGEWVNVSGLRWEGEHTAASSAVVVAHGFALAPVGFVVEGRLTRHGRRWVRRVLRARRRPGPTPWKAAHARRFGR